MVAADTVPCDARREGYTEAGADEFAYRHRAVALEYHVWDKACHAAVEVCDGTKGRACFQRNESRFLKFIQIDRRFSGMRIRIRHSQHDVFLEERHRVVILDRIDGGGQEEIHMILVLLTRLIVLLQDLETDIRMLLTETGEESRDDHRSREKRDGDGELLCFLGISQFLLRAVQLLHDAVRMAEQDLAISCEDNISTASGKERYAELCLKYLDGMGQGRLGNVKGFCCARQVLQLGCLLEIAQGEQCQFHGDPPND